MNRLSIKINKKITDLAIKRELTITLGRLELKGASDAYLHICACIYHLNHKLFIDEAEIDSFVRVRPES